MSEQVAMRKKVTIGTVYGKVNLRELDEDGTPKWLVRVFAKANNWREGPSNYDRPSLAFFGQFQFQNLVSGEVFNGSKAYFPDIVADPLAAQMGDKESGFHPAEFVIDIGAMVSMSAPIGYEFVIKSHIDPSGESDPIAKLKDKFSQLALPEPGKIESRNADRKGKK